MLSATNVLHHIGTLGLAPFPSHRNEKWLSLSLRPYLTVVACASTGCVDAGACLRDGQTDARPWHVRC